MLIILHRSEKKMERCTFSSADFQSFVHDTYKTNVYNNSWTQRSALIPTLSHFAFIFRLLGGKKNADHPALAMDAVCFSQQPFCRLKRKASSVLLYVRCGLLDLSRLQKSFAAYAPAQLPFVLRQCPEVGMVYHIIINTSGLDYDWDFDVKERYLHDESFDRDSLCLTNSMDAHNSLFFNSRIPPRVLQQTR